VGGSLESGIQATDYDFGFKVQAMYGTDARFTHYLGELDYIINDRSQLTPVEVWGIVHTPWLFSGGIDIKAGQYVTLEGAETIDPTTHDAFRWRERHLWHSRFRGRHQEFASHLRRRRHRDVLEHFQGSGYRFAS
jgi:putative OmpL-like beta-barrel porin-2